MLTQKTKSSPTVAAIHPVPDVLSKKEGRFFAASFMERIKEFTKVLEAPANSDGDEESRLKWLASQVVGANANMVTPFGHRRITYCDHTASGRFLAFIEKLLRRKVLPYYGNTHTVDNYVGLYMSELVKQATNYIKSCTGAGPNDGLLYCGSGSTAAIKRLQEVIGIAVPPPLRRRVLDSLLPSERWVVFLGPYEHHSNLLSWRQSLAEVVEIGLDEHGKVNLVALEEALLSKKYEGRPKLGSFSACSNVTGVHTDTRAVAILLHRHGAYACFDYACSGPYTEIDMRSGEDDGYDAVFLSPHKFIGGPGTPGILLINDALYLLKGGPPSTSGGGTVLYVNGYKEEETLYSTDLQEREDAGTPPIVQKLRAALAFAVKSYIGQDVIHRREAALWLHASSRLSENPRIRILGENNKDNLPIFSFIVYPKVRDSGGKHLHCHFTSRLLNDIFGIQARGGCACAGPYSHLLLDVSREQSLAYRSAIEKGYDGLKPGFTRVSFTYYMALDEINFVLDAIKFVSKYGYRFLPLYNFDWKTGAWDFACEDCAMRPSVGIFKAALRALDTLFDESRSQQAILYDKYLRFAREFGKALPSTFSMAHLPEDVDPSLVTFMI